LTQSPIEHAAPHHELSNRHIQFIAIGGAIGAGLFIGSGASIEGAGPAVLLAYALCGVFIFFMARALGELTLIEPAQDAFASYAERHIGSVAGFVTGWSYWANWILVGAAEITACGLLMRFWFPALPQWIPSLLALIAIYGANMRAVRLFGEIEFWLSLIKIVTIVALIGLGLALLFLPGIPKLPGASVTNLFDHGGFFPKGVSGMVQILPIALFAFGGVEVIALTAREARDPARSIPRAINGVVLRILIFYVGTMFVAMSIAPWTSYSGAQSPFVSVFSRAGIGAAASIINFVVLTAVLSSCNTGLFATGRMLAGIAGRGEAPAGLSMMNVGGLPGRAITVSALCLLLAVLLNWLVPDRAFGILMSATAYLLLGVWTVILVAHYRMRRGRSAAAASPFPMPFFPVSSWIALGAILLAVALMVSDPANFVATIVAVGWYAALTVVALLLRNKAGIAVEPVAGL
jgi:AAT family amino acid transporter/D-serine/D-alanine/glycine transporter